MGDIWQGPARRAVLIAIVFALTIPSASFAASAIVASRAPLGPPAETEFDHEGEPRYLEEVALAGDPLTWAVEPTTGLRFRAATAYEREANGWPIGAFLVEQGAGHHVTLAAPSASIVIPTGPATAATFDVPLFDTYVSPPIVAQPEGGEPTMTTPLISRYVLTPEAATLAAVTGAGFVLYADENGGWSGTGSFNGLVVDLVGPEPARILAPIGTTGAPLGPVSLVIVVPADTEMDHCGFLPAFICNIFFDPQCSDGEDNDGDLWVDYPDDPGCSSASDDSETDSRFSYNFGLFGEIKWGTANKANIDALLNQIGDEIDDGFDGNGKTRADLVPTFYHYWYHTTQTNANNCANNGGCTDSAGHAYPFNGCVAVATCYRDRAWNDVSHARQHFSFGQLKVAQVQHLGSQTDPGGSLCGLSRFPPGGDSVSIGRPYTSTGCKDYVSTHEVGHSFDATHNNVLVNGCGTVMAQSSAVSCRSNYFHNTNRKEVNDCVLQSNCPRSGTG